MDLRDLEAVVAVSEHGSFSDAARAMFVAQPSLSKRIKQLEAELGAALFDRTPRGVRLTAAGEAFVVPARAAISLTEGAREAVTAVTGLDAGTLRLAALPTIVVTHLVPLMSRFRAEHEHLSIHLLGAENHRLAVSLVHDGLADLALCDRPVVAPGLDVEHAFDQEMVVVLPPGSRTRRRRVRLQELADHPVVMTTPGTSTRELVDELYAGAGLAPRIVVETDLRDALIPSVLAGAGLTFVSEALGRSAEQAGAVVVRLVTPPVRPVFFVVRRGPRSPALREFLDAAVAVSWQRDPAAP